MLRGKHGNEEEIKHRASADTSDSRTMGDVNGKFDLGGSAPASFVSIFVCRVIPPYRFIPYATPMFDVFHRVIRPKPSIGTGEPRGRLPSETEERTSEKEVPTLVESNRNNRIDFSAPKRYLAEGCGKVLMSPCLPWASLLPPEEVCRPTQLTTGVRGRDIPRRSGTIRGQKWVKGRALKGKKMIR